MGNRQEKVYKDNDFKKIWEAEKVKNLQSNENKMEQKNNSFQ